MSGEINHIMLEDVSLSSIQYHLLPAYFKWLFPTKWSPLLSDSVLFAAQDQPGLQVKIVCLSANVTSQIHEAHLDAL